MEKELYSPEQLRELLADRNMREVSARSGIPYNTVKGVRIGKDLRASTLQRLTEYLDRKQEAA